MPAARNPNHELLRDARSGLRRAFFIVFAFSLFVNLLMLAGPLFMLQVFDRVLTSRSLDTLYMLAAVTTAALITLGLLDVVRSRITVAASGWMDRVMASSLFEGAVYRTLARPDAPSIQALRDLRAVRGFVSSPQLFAFFDAPWAPFFLFVMFALHPYLGIVATIGAVILFVLAVLNEWLTRAPAAQDGGASIAAMSIADATVRNADAVGAMGMYPNMAMRWQELSARSRANQLLAEKRTATIVSTSKFARMTLQMAILGVGATLAIAGEITPGMMIAGSILMSRALAPVEQAIGAWRAMLNARQGWKRVAAQLLEQPVTPESMELPAPTGNLMVSGVSCLLSGLREPTLRNISFALKAGESLAIIGPSGSGKSTLARLLLGNLAPSTGHVRLDGMDVSAWSPTQLGPHLGYLPQDVELFAGTVKDNIARMGLPVPENVVSAAQMAGCHELILSLPEGYDTVIGDRGNTLSGGTRQRIGLARALYGAPRFVVLDEPNSNLDGQGEAALGQALAALKQASVTVIVIGHRQSTLTQADKVLMLTNGTVQQFGTRDEVLKALGGAATASPGTPRPADAAPTVPRIATINGATPTGAASKAAEAEAANTAPSLPGLNGSHDTAQAKASLDTAEQGGEALAWPEAPVSDVDIELPPDADKATGTGKSTKPPSLLTRVRHAFGGGHPSAATQLNESEK